VALASSGFACSRAFPTGGIPFHRVGLRTSGGPRRGIVPLFPTTSRNSHSNHAGTRTAAAPRTEPECWGGGPNTPRPYQGQTVFLSAWVGPSPLLEGEARAAWAQERGRGVPCVPTRGTRCAPGRGGRGVARAFAASPEHKRDSHSEYLGAEGVTWEKAGRSGTDTRKEREETPNELLPNSTGTPGGGGSFGRPYFPNGPRPEGGEPLKGKNTVLAASARGLPWRVGASVTPHNG